MSLRAIGRVTLLATMCTLVVTAAPPGVSPAAAVPSTSGAVHAMWADRQSSDSRRWAPPVWPVVILDPFTQPVDPYSRGHRGVDLLAHEQISATGPGIVSFSGEVAGRPVVTITMGRLKSTVEPVRSLLPVGSRVTAGQVIGTLDDAGATSHCGRQWSCVHWGVRLDGAYIDPLRTLQWRRPVLKSHLMTR